MTRIFTEHIQDQVVLPKNSCLLNYSVLQEFYSASPYRSFSVKYVIRGSELYSVNGTRHLVKDRQYLLANRHSEGYIEIDSPEPVSGICIDLAPAMLSEAVASHLRPDAPESDVSLDLFFDSPEFLENTYKAGDTAVGRLLLELESRFGSGAEPCYEPDADLYYALAGKVVEDHVPVFKAFRNVKAIRSETRKELYRRLLRAKEYMQQCFKDGITVPEAARHCGMSEYHFFRLFKSAFGLSPHQYLLGYKLDFARRILEQERPEVTDLALLSGFPDIHSFSKAFKKRFGCSPSGYKLAGFDKQEAKR